MTDDTHGDGEATFEPDGGWAIVLRPSARDGCRDTSAGLPTGTKLQLGHLSPPQRSRNFCVWGRDEHGNVHQVPAETLFQYKDSR